MIGPTYNYGAQMDIAVFHTLGTIKSAVSRIPKSVWHNAQIVPYFMHFSSACYLVALAYSLVRRHLIVRLAIAGSLA